MKLVKPSIIDLTFYPVNAID